MPSSRPPSTAGSIVLQILGVLIALPTALMGAVAAMITFTVLGSVDQASQHGRGGELWIVAAFTAAVTLVMFAASYAGCLMARNAHRDGARIRCEQRDWAASRPPEPTRSPRCIDPMPAVRRPSTPMEQFGFRAIAAVCVIAALTSLALLTTAPSVQSGAFLIVLITLSAAGAVIAGRHGWTAEYDTSRTTDRAWPTPGR